MRLAGNDCRFGCGDLSLCGDYGRVAGIEFCLLLIEQLGAGKTAFGQLAKTFEFLAGQQLFALAQLHVGFVGSHGLTGALHFGFCLRASGFKGASVHAGQQLAFGHMITFVDQDLGQAARNFGGDLHFCGFESTVTHADTFREPVVLGFPVTESACSDQQYRQRNNEIMGNTMILRHADILCHRAL